jgi:hypothetical protein
MFIHKIAISLLLMASASSALAQGTPQQRSACARDVRKFCHALPRGSDDMAYEHCLRSDHDKLSEACRAVIDGR